MHLHVTCAIIEKDGKILVAQRSGKMSMPLKWEFPGGKIHDGESSEECLKRELREELGVEVEIIRALAVSSHKYPTFSITLYPFICSITGGTLTLHEHGEVRWILPAQLPDLDWAEADVPVVNGYLKPKC